MCGNRTFAYLVEITNFVLRGFWCGVKICFRYFDRPRLCFNHHIVDSYFYSKCKWSVQCRLSSYTDDYTITFLIFRIYHRKMMNSLEWTHWPTSWKKKAKNRLEVNRSPMGMSQMAFKMFSRNSRRQLHRRRNP